MDDQHAIDAAAALRAQAWSEAAVLRVGHAYQQATDWHRRQPPVAASPPATVGAPDRPPS